MWELFGEEGSREGGEDREGGKRGKRGKRGKGMRRARRSAHHLLKFMEDVK
jgi:hypothetical protein